MTTNEPPPPVLCSVCGEPENDHDYIHPFTPPGESVDTSFLRPRQRSGPAVRLPFDPVLRQVLLEKGVVTPEDIAGAEQKVLGIMGEQVSRGDGPEPR